MIGRLTAAAVLLVLFAALPAEASAHPLGNFTVNRALHVEIGSSIRLTAILDLAEIPAYEVIRDLDTDGDDAVGAAEGEPYASVTCESWAGQITVTVDGRQATLQPAAPSLSFPTGAGDLPTLRLECPFTVGAASSDTHELRIRDGTVDERAGWREVSARAAGTATIEASDVPETSPTALLTAYPDAALASPPDVRAATLTFTLASATGVARPASTPGSVAGRSGEVDPLAGLIGGALSPGAVALAVLLSLGLGAAHALSPGHGKTLVAAYVLGSGGSARAALQIGLGVAVSHTAGVLVLGAITLAASELLVPERVIAWLSLGSGIVVTGLGLVLLARLIRSRWSTGGHTHHDHPHDHEHPHPTTGELTWRSAIALGFAGGAVPSASALIVLLVAISTDRLLLGIGLIACFGIGMAVVLGGLALLTSRLRQLATDSRGWTNVAPVRLALRLAPVAAGLVVLASGLAFTVAAIGQLA